METKYTIQKNQLGVEYVVRENDDNTVSWIPIDPANADYQEYLAANEATNEL